MLMWTVNTKPPLHHVITPKLCNKILVFQFHCYSISNPSAKLGHAVRKSLSFVAVKSVKFTPLQIHLFPDTSMKLNL